MNLIASVPTCPNFGQPCKAQHATTWRVLAHTTCESPITYFAHMNMLFDVNSILGTALLLSAAANTDMHLRVEPSKKVKLQYSRAKFKFQSQKVSKMKTASMPT